MHFNREVQRHCLINAVMAKSSSVAYRPICFQDTVLQNLCILVPVRVL